MIEENTSITFYNKLHEKISWRDEIKINSTLTILWKKEWKKWKRKRKLLGTKCWKLKGGKSQRRGHSQ